MKEDTKIIISGFGGQGILFAGKLIATAGMISGREVSWIPSYGAEMRGGTANCHVIVSENAIGSPVVSSPNTLIVMNTQSLDKFENQVATGGVIVVDNSFIDREVRRKDVKSIEIPASILAEKMGACKLANMVLLGRWIKETQCFDVDVLINSLKKLVPVSKSELIDLNINAIKTGYTN